MSYQTIQKSQIKIIHTLKSAIKMTEEDYRALLQSKFNKKSSTELTEFQAKILINLLKSWAPEKSTWTQKNKINILFDKLKINKENRNKFISEKLGYRTTLSQLTKQEASKLIYILEKIMRWENE